MDNDSFTESYYMKNRIKLFWYKHPKGKGNFGDELNPYIIKKISDVEIDYINLELLNEKKWLAFKILLKGFITNKIGLVNFIQYFIYNFFTHPKVLLVIGSVLHVNNYSNCQVWGAGIINNKYKFSNADFLAVRGPYTQNKIRQLDYKPPQVIGDPAILLPLVYKPKVQKKYKIGIIPHFVHYDLIKKKFPPEVLVINLLNDIEFVIDQIFNCELTLSTSLHGIIVSHSYGIPSLWVDFQEIDAPLYGDNVKFKDYFSSVKLNEYDVCRIPEIKNHQFLNLINSNIKKYKNMLLPEENVIKSIQENLLEVAPFNLKIKYKK